MPVFWTTICCLLLVGGSVYCKRVPPSMTGKFLDVIENTNKMTTYRLPNDTSPISYKLLLFPLMNATLFNPNTVDSIPEQSRFDGELELKITVNQVTRQITLHAAELEVRSVRVYKESGMELSVTDLEYAPQDQMILIRLSNELVYSNIYLVKISYTGTHNNRMKGFYQSVYPHSNGLRILAATQFEPTYARYAFPCYDEPKFRTTFNISIAIREPYRVISNMPVNNVTTHPQYGSIWEFKTTSPMATYLVAFVVSTLSAFDTKDRIEVWARENAIENGKYIADRAPRLLKALENVIGIAYSLPKLDIVAIPDFAAGAMENWGLTTYRESRTLISERSTTRQKRMALEVVAHEFSHQWFGDLVTPIWWNCVWLNEAFATYYEYFITSIAEPTWRLHDFFVIEELQAALKVDGDSQNHPMTQSVKDPQEINSLFDHIIYNKGGSILRMLQHSISKPTFNKAITTYLKKGVEAGGTVTPANLFDALEDAVRVDKALPSDVSVTQLMKSWTEQEGYPLLTVTRDYASKTIIISQTLYQHLGKPNSNKFLWLIPLTYATKNKPDFETTTPSMWLMKETRNDFLPIHGTDWVIFNLQQIGYYRVNYDNENWNLILQQFFTKPEDIHVLNRAQIIDDSFNLAKDGIIGFKLPFTLASYLISETDIIPWYAAINIFRDLKTMFQSTLVHPLLETFVSKLIKEQYKRYGLIESEKDNFVTKISRSVIANAACLFKHSKCVDDATAIMKEWMQSSRKMRISPDIMSTVFCTGIVHGTNQEWLAVDKFYSENAMDSSLAEIVLPTLGCTNNVTLLESFLQRPFTHKLPYRAQDNRYIFDSLSKHPAITAAFNVIEKRVPLVKADNTDEMYLLLNIISSLGKYAQSDEHLKRMVMLKESDKFEAAPAEIKEIMEAAYQKAKLNHDRRDRNVALIKAQLTDEIKNSTGDPTTTYRPPSGASAHFSSLLIVAVNLCCIFFALKYVIIGN